MRTRGECDVELEKLTDLAPKHPPPGVVSFEDAVQPLQLRLAELGVMEEPALVLGLEAFTSSDPSFSATEYCNKSVVGRSWTWLRLMARNVFIMR